MIFDVDAVERAIGIRFRDPELLKRAFVDRSAVPSGYIPECNTRLAFLGDGLLRGMLRDIFYPRFEFTIIALQQYEVRLLSNKTMNAYVQAQGWGQFIITGDYEWGGDVAIDRANKHEATVFEAIVGAIFLDQGYDATVDYLQQTYLRDMEAVMQIVPPVGMLQRLHEYVALRYGRQPIRTKQVFGRDPSNRKYAYQYKFDGFIGHGTARTKNEAKEQAAKSLLEQLMAIDTTSPEIGGSS